MTTPEEILSGMAQQMAALTDLFAKAEMKRAQEQANQAQEQDVMRGNHTQQKLQARFMKLHEFDGKPELWSDWSFTFKRSIRAQCPEAFALMGRAEAKEAESKKST